MKNTINEPGILERRAVAIIINGILFVTNFLLIYFICLLAFPEVTGLLRVGICWAMAYANTWMMTYLTKGGTRLALTLFLLAALGFVFTFHR